MTDVGDAVDWNAKVNVPARIVFESGKHKVIVNSVGVVLSKATASLYSDVILSFNIMQKTMLQLPLWSPPDAVEEVDGNVFLIWKIEPAWVVHTRRMMEVVIDVYMDAPLGAPLEVKIGTADASIQ